MIPHMAIQWFEKLVWRAERPDFGSERSDLGDVSSESLKRVSFAFQD